jgi:hypothetical protein
VAAHEGRPTSLRLDLCHCGEAEQERRDHQHERDPRGVAGAGQRIISIIGPIICVHVVAMAYVMKTHGMIVATTSNTMMVTSTFAQIGHGSACRLSAMEVMSISS